MKAITDPRTGEPVTDGDGERIPMPIRFVQHAFDPVDRRFRYLFSISFYEMFDPYGRFQLMWSTASNAEDMGSWLKGWFFRCQRKGADDIVARCGGSENDPDGDVEKFVAHLRRFHRTIQSLLLIHQK